MERIRIITARWLDEYGQEPSFCNEHGVVFNTDVERITFGGVADGVEVTYVRHGARPQHHDRVIIPSFASDATAWALLDEFLTSVCEG